MDFNKSQPFLLPLPQEDISSAVSTTSPILRIETVIFFATLLVYLLFKLRQSFNLSKGKLPCVSYFPIPLPTFVSGFYSLYRTKNDGLKFFKGLVSKYGTFFEVPIAFEKALCIGDPAIAQKILTSSDPMHLNKPKQIYHIFFPDAFRDGLIVADYDVWSVHRKIMSRSFTYKSLQTYLPFMNEHGKNLVSKLKALCSPPGKGESVEGKEVSDLIWSETIKIITQTAANSDVCTDEETVIIHDSFKRGKQIVAHKFLHPELMLAPIWWLHPMRKELDKLIVLLRGIATEQLDIFREQSIERAKARKLSLESNDSNPSADDNDLGLKSFKCVVEEMFDSGASDEQIFAEIGTFVTAGHETTALAISLLLYHLACYPEYQSLCREEIDSILHSKTGDNPNYNLTMDDLSDLKYLERCILESLRLTPTIPSFVRRLDAPLKLSHELTLERGKTLIISPWAIHRNPEIYPTPEIYNPDRFLPEIVKERHPYAFMPFSGGPRNCIGYKYAILEMKVIVGWLLHNFEVSTSVKPEDIQWNLELTVMPDRDLGLVLTKRKMI